MVKNFDPEKLTEKLLKELCIQGGPVRNVVVRPDHAFVEFEDIESVGYTKALLDGIQLFGKNLTMEPRLREARFYTYNKSLVDYINYDRYNRQQKEMQAQMQIQQQQQQQYHSQLQQHQQQQQYVQMPQPQPQMYHPRYQPPSQMNRSFHDRPRNHHHSYGNKRRR